MRAVLRRGAIDESVHIGYSAETDDEGRLLSACGIPDFVTTLRSAAKPLQAIPLTTLENAETLQLTDEELAICCASHPGLARHAALVASALSRSGFDSNRLVCGPAGEPPSPLRHGCSGNHTAMVLASLLLGASLEGYERPDHPVQRHLRRQIGEMAGLDSIPIATDGCGVPTYGLSLRQMARAFAVLTRPGEVWERIPRVMGAHPELIGDETWIDVRLMQATAGRIVAKTGAEGLLCLGLPGQSRGMAVKIVDGSTRALGLLALDVLERAGWLTSAEARHPLLADLRHPRYYGSEGNIVADIIVTTTDFRPVAGGPD